MSIGEKIPFFLHDLGDEDNWHAQLLKAQELDPNLPSAWNNMAEYYLHDGPIIDSIRLLPYICADILITVNPIPH